MVDFEFEFQYAEAKQTTLRDIRLPERLIMIVAVIFRFFPVLSGDMKLLRQSVATRGIDLKRRKSNFLSLRFSALDAVFAAVLLAAMAAGLLL